MLKKRSFPDDWSNLTYDQVSDNIKYLLQNYRRYKISVSDDNTVHIGNVNISDVHVANVLRYKFDCIKVNNRQITITGDDLNVFIDMLRLREMCEYELKPFKQKVKEWCAYNPLFVASGVCGALVALIIGSLMAGHYLNDYGMNNKTQLKQEIKDTTTKIQNDTVNYVNQNQR